MVAALPGAAAAAPAAAPMAAPAHREREGIVPRRHMGPTAALALLAAEVTGHRGGTTAHRVAAEVADRTEEAAPGAVVTTAVAATADVDREW